MNMLFILRAVPITVLLDVIIVIMFFTPLQIRIYHMKRKALKDLATGLYLGKDETWVRLLIDAWSTESLFTYLAMATSLTNDGFNLTGVESLQVVCDAYDCVDFVTVPMGYKESVVDHGWTALAWESMYYCPTCATERELITDEQQ